MAGSSLSSHGEEYPYPYPSHVFVPSFVSVKLSGREMYGLWKTQMLCLLEGHGMLDFIHTGPQPKSDRGKEKVGDYMLWRRSDALIKGWILGSLSEHVLRHAINLLKTYEEFTAKDVWDKLETIYGPPPPLVQPDLDEEFVIQSEDAESNNEAKRDEKKEAEKRKEEEEKKKRAEKRAEDLQRLYKATLDQNFAMVDYILRDERVKLTEKITINGNTTLHVAVGTTKNTKFLESMLNLAAKENPRLDMKNSEGSTLRHVAAIVGNTEAAKILVEKDRELLFVLDKEGHTPLVRAFSNMHTDTYLFLLKSTNVRDIERGTLFAGTSGDELLVNAISANHYSSTLFLIRHYRSLHSDAVLMAIAQNFPRKLGIWERMVYKVLIVAETLAAFMITMITGIVGQFPRSMLIPICFAGAGAMFLIIFGVVFGIYMLLLYIMTILVKCSFKFLEDRALMHDDAMLLLEAVCYLIKNSQVSNSHHFFYTNPVLEATRQNAYEVVVIIVSLFPNAIWSTNEDGHNIIQLAVMNRSEKVYNLLYQMSEHKNIYKTISDPFGNNLLHLAARLAPTNKLNHISGAALQIQRELQWFKEVEGFVCPLNIIQKNSFGETPQMVFTREHKQLVIEGEKWMKATAESYTITAALITTIVFAAAITVPGGNNQDTGIPVFTNISAFTIFAISDAISLFTSVTSLLLFLSILTTRYAEQDFLFKLPTKLVIGLAALFISTTAMIVAFGATLFLVFGQRKSWILIPIAALTCLPIISFVTLQFPLIVDLVSSTYGQRIFGKKSEDPFY